MNNLPEKRKDTIPGLCQESGMVMCPFFKGACLKSACELWVELTYSANTENERKVARCSLAWISILSPEIRASIDKLNLHKEAIDVTKTPVGDTKK